MDKCFLARAVLWGVGVIGYLSVFWGIPLMDSYDQFSLKERLKMVGIIHGLVLAIAIPMVCAGWAVFTIKGCP